MSLSVIEQSLLLSVYYRGNTIDQNRWTSSSDQVVTLSLFYTGGISFSECESRFGNRRYIGGLYTDDGELHPMVAIRYSELIELLKKHPDLIEGGGDFQTPAYPTYTACRLTAEGDQLALSFMDSFPQKPDFPSWPDARTPGKV